VAWGGGSAFIFDSGATLSTSGNIQLGGAGATTTLGFTLDADGFDALSCGGVLYFGAAGDDYDSQTIKVDMADYTGGVGTNVLMDLNGNNGMTDAIFQGLDLVVDNAGAYAGSYLQWNETDSAIELVIVPNTWDGGGADNNWSTGLNWSTDTVPGNGSTVQIGSGSTVSFDYASGWPTYNAAEVNLDGTLTSAGAVRSWGTVWNIGATATLDLGNGWVVPWGGGSAFIFDSGATLSTSGNIQLGGAGATTTLGFTLDAGGFDALSCGGVLYFGGAGDDYDSQTIKVDMADYTGDPGTNVLLDLNGNNGMTDVIFQGLNLVVTNAGAYEGGSSLKWNETDSAIELVIDPSNTWDGGGSDDNWNTAANWTYDSVPGASDEVVIGSSYTVTNAQSEFATLSIGAGSTVTFGEALSGGVVTNAGTMDYAGVFRLNGAAVHLTGTGGLGANITFLDLNGGDLSFEDGASFGNAGMSFEHKGANRFDFELSASGFTMLSAGTLHLSSDIANATYVVDMANYTGSPQVIDLMAFSSGGTLTDAQFQTATLTVLNSGSYTGAALRWDDTSDKVQLFMVTGTLFKFR